MPIEIFDDYEQLSQAAADQAIALVKRKPEANLGLSTGSTPRRAYQIMAERASAEGVDFSKVSWFALDEYYGPDALYTKELWREILGPIHADPARVHIPDGTRRDFIEASTAYETALDEAGKVDLWLVGIGRNGHIAFNEPGCPVAGNTRLVQLSAETIQDNARFFQEGERQPKAAITVGFKTLKDHAAKILVLASGEAKSEAIRNSLERPVNPRVPATILRTFPPGVVTWMCDRDAARDVSPDVLISRNIG